MCNVNEVLEELAGDIFVCGVFFRQFQRNGQHVQAVHSHPACAVGLLEVTSRRQGRRAVKDTNVIESQESALKNIRSAGILTIDPPGKIQEQLVKNFFQESAIGDAAHAPLDFVNSPGGPGMNRRASYPLTPSERTGAAGPG